MILDTMPYGIEPVIVRPNHVHAVILAKRRRAIELFGARVDCGATFTRQDEGTSRYCLLPADHLPPCDGPCIYSHKGVLSLDTHSWCRDVTG